MTMLTKKEKIELLHRKYGYDCFICGSPFGNEKPTIEHWIPRAAGGSDDISNLRLTHKSCNVMKSDTMPNPDGTITLRPKKIPYYKRRSDRREILDKFCYECEDGRKLYKGETCVTCGSPPGPLENPRYLKRKSPECDHNVHWCWACSIGIVEKKSAAQNLITG
jgi:hypothetical protein